MKTAYLDNMIVSALVRSDLANAAEMRAVNIIWERKESGQMGVVTSQVAWHEQERTKNVKVRQQLEAKRHAIDVVKREGRIESFNILRYRSGTFIANPIFSDVIDEELLRRIVNVIGKGDPADARHLMNAAANECDWFVTTDERLLDHALELKELCLGLRIVSPSQLVKELEEMAP